MGFFPTCKGETDMTKEELEGKLLVDMQPHTAYCEDFLADNYEVDIEDIHEAMLELRQQKHVFECGTMVSFNEPRWVRI